MLFPPWADVLVGVILALVASSGFWAFMLARQEKKDKNNQILLGLGHDRITYLAKHYVERGDWITFDEYENLYNYLWKPYKDKGGNGSAERAMEEVKKLRMVNSPPCDTCEEGEHDE